MGKEKSILARMYKAVWMQRIKKGKIKTPRWLQVKVRKDGSIIERGMWENFTGNKLKCARGRKY